MVFKYKTQSEEDPKTCDQLFEEDINHVELALTHFCAADLNVLYAVLERKTPELHF